MNDVKHLFERAVTGDKDSLEQLFERFLPHLIRFGQSRLGNLQGRIDVEDVVQETALKTMATIRETFWLVVRVRVDGLGNNSFDAYQHSRRAWWDHLRRPKNSRVFAIILAAMLCLASIPAAIAQITLDTGFDSGSLDLDASTVDGNVVTLQGLPTWTAEPNHHRWIYFRASGVEGLRPRFRLQGSYLGELSTNFFYSYDQAEWFEFERGRLQLSQPFIQDEVFIAHAKWLFSSDNIQTDQVACYFRWSGRMQN